VSDHEGARLRPITEVARDLEIAAEELEPYGRDKAKVRLEALQRAEASRPSGKRRGPKGGGDRVRPGGDPPQDSGGLRPNALGTGKRIGWRSTGLRVSQSLDDSHAIPSRILE
jgi:hypothetical protein